MTGLAAKMPAMNDTLSFVKKASVTPVPMMSASSGRSAARCAVSGIRASVSGTMRTAEGSGLAGRRLIRLRRRLRRQSRLGGAAGGPARLLVAQCLRLELLDDFARLPAEFGHRLSERPRDLGQALRTEHHERDHEDHDELRHADAKHPLASVRKRISGVN